LQAIGIKDIRPSRGNWQAGGRFFGESVLNCEFSLKPVNFVAKPLLEDLFAFGGIHGGDSSALGIQRNVVARHIFAFARLGDVLHKNAFSARMSAERIAKIQAG
jgi:hypothetical protein